MTMLYPNLRYNKVCYRWTALSSLSKNSVEIAILFTSSLDAEKCSLIFCLSEICLSEHMYPIRKL